MTFLIYILLSGILGVTGQLTLKRALVATGPLALAPETLIVLMTNPFIVLGVAVMVSGTFFWLIALSRVDLSFAYPFASLNYVVILGASWLILGEAITPIRLAGVAVICLGVCLIARTPRRTERRAHAGEPVAVAVLEGQPT